MAQAVPAIQANVFLCFRVILLRMSSQHVTSLWPTIISELVQVLLQIEQELVTNTEEFSNHIKLLSALDNSWVTNANNGLSAHGNPQWLQLQLAAAKLLDLALLLPAKELPQFQMYRWAFVSDVDLSHMDYVEDDITTKTKSSSTNNNPSSTCVFVPHVCRLSRLMDVCYKDQRLVEPVATRQGELLLTAQSIKSLKDLHQFFKTLSYSWSSHMNIDQDTSHDRKDDALLDRIESVLEDDFIDKMPES
uniref:Putative secreted protein n=1 Tax=Xenopsylla cheopis TaxID=163159 RepID=A0A6M2E1Y7_XENCH